jgi:protein O-GlcNAc transferase
VPLKHTNLKSHLIKMNPSPQTLTIPQAIKLGLQHHQTGNVQQAESIYRQILQVAPDNAEVLHLLGVVFAQAKAFDKAIELINKAIALNDTVPNFYSSLGIALSGQKKLEQAIDCFKRVIDLEPNHQEAHYNLGNIYLHQDKLVEAAHHYQQFLAINPSDAMVHNSLGVVQYKQGKTAEAVTCYQSAIDLNSNDASLYHNLGNALSALGKFSEAITNYQHALKITPNDAQLYKHLGNALRSLNQLDEAIAAYQHAIVLNPSDAGARNNLGTVFNRVGKLAEAQTCYQQALNLDPNFSEAGSNLGSTLLYQGRVDNAITHYQQVLEKQPAVLIHSNLLFALHYATDFEASAVFSEHKKFNAQYAIPLAASIKPHLNDRDSQRKLKIGYVSTDFKEHSVAYFIESILAHHDHEQFEISCYYNAVESDEVTERLKQSVHHWTDCIGLSDEELAERIRQDAIDILIDLSGHTNKNRLLVFARKPAPVQVSYLGYPNTTGLSTIDYRITDNYVEPEEPEGVAESFSSEALLRMPNSYFCYRPNDHSPQVNKLPALQNGYVTFGSFNNYAKLNSEILAIWTKVLHAVPDSKLFIKARSINDPTTLQTFREHLAKLGIESERLIFANYAHSTEEHLKTYHQIDIGLDTYPYNGATTSCEALWMGVPVVTLAGDKHAARMGLSILSAIGLTELIAHNPETYIDICVKLANDTESLQKLRKETREKMQKSPLMDGITFTHNLEAAYRKMWVQWI